jgi:aspartyl-tRNA(Asn)/glutamyl-tRNA(Gln) amidotransferase subunit A
MINLTTLTIKTLQAGYAAGDFSVRQITDAYLDQIKNQNEEIFAFVEVYNDIDVQVARAEKMIAEGKIAPLTGVPVAIKDNMLNTGKVASAGSTILSDYTATYDTDVVKNLKEQGAIILGRTNMDDAAMGSSTETSAHGLTKNPLDTSRVPGGSSGGAAAAVAMNGTLVSLGSDTGGSIRQPAAFCGLVGLKPTYGSISRSGLIAMASSLDIIGPITKTVADAESVFHALARHDSLDSTSISEEIRAGVVKRTPKKIGVPRSFLSIDGVDPEILADFEKSLDRLREKGYEIVDIDLPLAEYALAVYYILMPAEVSSNLARLDGIRYGFSAEGKDLTDSYVKTRTKGFGKEVRRRILLGTYILSHGYYDAYYNKARLLGAKITEDFEKVFETVDAIATPTTPTGAFRFGEKSNNPVEMYLSDIFTVPANIAGLPAISIPSGKDKNNMPLGLHLTAPYLQEDVLFTIGKDFE